MASRSIAARHSRVSITKRVDRKSTRLNSSHDQISYAVFCLKKKKKKAKNVLTRKKKTEARWHIKLSRPQITTEPYRSRRSCVPTPGDTIRRRIATQYSSTGT